MSSNSTGSPATLFENAFFIGMNMENILYGIELVLYFKTMHVFLSRRGSGQKSDVIYAVISTVMFIFVTIWVSTEAIFGQRMWLLHRNYPGGPLAYGAAHTSDVYMDFGTTSSILLQQMTDGLMLYRCRIVWDSFRAIILPSTMWVGNIALGSLVIWTSCTPGTNFFSGLAAKLGLAYYVVSVIMNAILTCMICFRLVCHAKTVKKYLGKVHASPYISIIMILVESVLPYTLCGIAFLVSYGIGSQTAISFSCVYTLMMCVSPQMLILRVAEGKAWKKDSMKPPASVMFPPDHGDISASDRFDRNGAAMVHLETLPSLYHPDAGEDLEKA